MTVVKKTMSYAEVVSAVISAVLVGCIFWAVNAEGRVKYVEHRLADAEMLEARINSNSLAVGVMAEQLNSIKTSITTLNTSVEKIDGKVSKVLERVE